jgi:hypothetical protein
MMLAFGLNLAATGHPGILFIGRGRAVVQRLGRRGENG